MADPRKIWRDLHDTEPVPEEDDGCENEPVEQRVRRYELLDAWIRADTAQTNVAEYQPQDYWNGGEWVDVVPSGTVRTIISGGVVNRLKYCLDGNYRRNDDKYNPYKSLQAFHENFSLLGPVKSYPQTKLQIGLLMDEVWGY